MPRKPAARGGWGSWRRDPRRLRDAFGQWAHHAVYNRVYHVAFFKPDPRSAAAGIRWQLSIGLRDGTYRHDWRELQRIKSELVGGETWAVEVYPAESQLVDLANRFTLWVYRDPLPYGYQHRRCVRYAGPGQRRRARA